MLARGLLTLHTPTSRRRAAPPDRTRHSLSRAARLPGGVLPVEVRRVRFVVAGGGVASLAAALAVARAGHEGVVLERDTIEPGADPRSAFADDRRGIPHFFQPHAFLPRASRVLASLAPDVFEALIEAGAEPQDVAARLRGEREPGDEDLVYLWVRRPPSAGRVATSRRDTGRLRGALLLPLLRTARRSRSPRRRPGEPAEPAWRPRLLGLQRLPRRQPHLRGHPSRPGLRP